MATKFANLSYDGKQIIPVPLVDINKSYVRGGNLEKVGSVFNITIEGKLLAYKGSPRSTGVVGDATFDGAFFIDEGYPADEIPNVKFDMLLNKQEHLRNLFSVDGRSLEIQSCNASAPVRCNPRINNISFAQGTWTEYIPYTISLEADFLLGEFASGVFGSGEDNFTQNLADANESWSLEFNDQAESHQRFAQHTFRLSHNLAARGKNIYAIDGSLTKPAWEWGRDWVRDRLGLDTSRINATGLLNLPTYFNAYNHGRAEQVDELGGSYAVTETWIISSGTALEDFTVTSTSDVTDPIRKVNIEGNIVGLENVQYTTSGLNFLSTKWENASGLFANISGQLYERAYSYAQANNFPRSLNPTPANFQINRNPVAGTISYSYGFDTRRLLCGDDSTVLSEVFSLSDDSPHNEIAIIPILGRAFGPLIQDLNTVSLFTRTASVELVTLPPTGCPFTAGGVNNILSQSPYWTYDVFFDSIQNHLEASYEQVFITQDQDSWTDNFSRYSRTVTWTIGQC